MSEQKSEQKLDSSTEKLVREAIEKGLTEGVALAARMTQPAPRPAPVFVDRTQCEVCKQQKSACNGEHAMLSVAPKDERFFAAFQGVGINGHWYLSSYPGHLIPVPKAAVPDIVDAIQRYEKNEADMLYGRKVSHNSGEVGRGARGFTPAQAAWR